MTAVNALLVQLERSRRELLDLTARNRLLNTPRHRKRSRSLEIVDELSDEIFRIMVLESKSMGFSSARAGEQSEEAGDLAEDELFADLAPPEEEDLDERGVAGRHRDIWLQTQLTPERLQKRLLGLYYDTRTAYEEQGVNILYLALGMLEWYEDASSDRARHAPLVLIPVGLERGSALQRFRLSWLEEDITSNLSLIEKFKTDFGLELPEVPDTDDLTLTDYFAAVEKAVVSQQRFAVHPNDVVLAFFSFSKFLMYRDLDPQNWPSDRALTEHVLVRGLLTDGFRSEPGIIGDDEPLDPHIGPLDLVHVLDADSSQTVAIEEVRTGRNLVIQGPPGTGKSQTIANFIATAVTAGKKVLFVAEKMAALEVVKRRLDALRIGDICLELHSRKANKRDVLESLRRTLELDRPDTGDLDDLAARLGTTRGQLNEHAARLHAPLKPSDETPYSVMGHLVRLGQKGVKPADFLLPQPENWTRQEFRERRGLVHELANRVAEIGTPVNHPWRGVGIDAVLPMDIVRFTGRITDLKSLIEGLIGVTDQLREALRSDVFDNSAKGIALLVNTALRVSEAPEGIDVDALCSSVWSERREALTDLVVAGKALVHSRSQLDGIVVDAAWSTDIATARRDMAAYGGSWFRILNGSYRRAVATLRGILAGPVPKSLGERLPIVDSLIAGQEAARAIATDDSLGVAAFGKLWRREKSDWSLLETIERWDGKCHQQPVPKDFRVIVAGVKDRQFVQRLALDVGGRIEPLMADCRALFAELRLDFQEAFGGDRLEEFPLRELVGRLNHWTRHSEDITRWIVYRTRAELAIGHGLTPIVERLYDDRLSPEGAVDTFEMTYYEALMRQVIQEQPALATFDGQEQQSVVDEFRGLDQARIEFARLQVMLSHYEVMPRAGQEFGQLGVLHREFNKKRRHLPIRQLMKHAGFAVQAIKPVFMMSPLSIAQFLEPGTIQFDLLLIDEASQVQPVDALGAVARANQIAVVGDDKQLPPTRFFTKILGDESEYEDDAELVSAGDIESILGLCAAQGMPQRMLRWHYRSRHPSLIAVSNHEFYDNRLYVVPSPYGKDTDLGLRFYYFSEGVYDSGGTATNRVEAGAIARAVIDHARSHPDVSLGVGCFSVRQRDAILDELEHLWRADRDVKNFFDPGKTEPFFVKNLENIQGDERDVIFISIGYARNKSGYMAMRFGPVSAEGGERRLNVLITRARERCEVFSSITADDIDLERGRGRGVAALKTFLQYAQSGTIGIAERTYGDYDSPFEEEVAKALSGLGLQVESQIGIAGFFVDLAVVDAARPGRYLIGIECDGAAYHSARSARDRDRLRQQVLEDHGWIIHRIWSSDWFQRPEEQLRKTVAAIEAAKAEWDKRDQALTEPRVQEDPERAPTTPKRVGSTSAEKPDQSVSSAPYQEADFDVPLNEEPHLIPVGKMAETVTRIVEIEGPVHADEIARRVTTLWGLQRTGSRIVAAVNKGISVAVRRETIVRDGKFCEVAGTAEPQVRDRSDVRTLTLRKPEMLPPSEIRAGLKAVVEAGLGVGREEAIVVVSRLLGFKAASAQLREIIGREVNWLIGEGVVVESGGLLQLPTPTA